MYPPIQYMPTYSVYIYIYDQFVNFVVPLEPKFVAIARYLSQEWFRFQGVSQINSKKFPSSWRPGDAGDGRQWRMTLMLLQNALVWQLQPDVMSWTMVRHGGSLKGWFWTMQPNILQKQPSWSIELIGKQMLGWFLQGMLLSSSIYSYQSFVVGFLLAPTSTMGFSSFFSPAHFGRSWALVPKLDIGNWPFPSWCPCYIKGALAWGLWTDLEGIERRQPTKKRVSTNHFFTSCCEFEGCNLPSSASIQHLGIGLGMAWVILGGKLFESSISFSLQHVATIFWVVQH